MSLEEKKKRKRGKAIEKAKKGHFCRGRQRRRNPETRTEEKKGK